MKRASRHIFSLLIVLAWVATLSGTQAQTRDQYVISAKAGKVNHASGKVTVRRRGSTDWRDELNSGDVVKTGADGRLEMLLNPGSYVRLAENSELELTDMSLDNLRLKLVSGSAIIEATGTDGTRLLARFSTPQTEVAIDRNGLYRLNVLPGSATEVIVRKGRVFLDSNLKKVSGGKKVVVSSNGSGGTAIVNFDKKAQDEFDGWSRQRAEALVAANRRLTNQTRATALASFRRGGSFGYGYAPYFGLWVFDWSLRGYTFLPFYDRWSSPYGFGYANGYGLPWNYYRPVVPRPGTIGGGNGSGTVGSHPPAPPSSPPVVGVPGRLPRKERPIDPGEPMLPREPMLPSRMGIAGKESAERFDRDFGVTRRSTGRRDEGGNGGSRGSTTTSSGPDRQGPANREPTVRTSSPAPSSPSVSRPPMGASSKGRGGPVAN